jgi:hypothetical protein
LFVFSPSIREFENLGPGPIILLHKVAEKDGDLVVTDAELTELVAYAKARTDANQLSVMTISEWYASQVSK